MRRTALGVGALLVWMAGCEGDAAGEAGAGFTPSPPAFRLEPEVRIDGYAEDLVPIGRTALREDGVIAFSQSQDGEVLFYDRDGARLASFGSSGEGPGEFRNFSWMGWIADTIWINDFLQNRTTWVAFGSEPTLLRTVPWGSMAPTPAFGDLPSFGSVFPQAMYADGTMLARFTGPEGRPAALEGEEIYGRISLEGEVLGIAARYRDRDNSVGRQEREGDRIVRSYSISNPWVIDTEIDFPGRADDVVFVFTDIQPDNSVILRVQRMAGLDTAWIREMRFNGVPITSSMADSAIDARVEGISENFASSWTDVGGHYRREATFPPILPPVRAIYAGPDGTLWIMLDTLEGYPAGTHLILDAEGELTGQVVVEEGTVMEVARDFAWLTVSDSLGVQSLVRSRVMSGG